MMSNVKEVEDIKQKLADLHFDQRLWINRIKFYKAELDILQTYLDQIVKYYSNDELMSEVEQYQNKIIVYREVADRLIKDYKGLRNRISDLSDSKSLDSENEEIVHDQEEILNKAKGFVEFVTELRDNFLVFYTSYHMSDNHVFGK
jgi:uncharacterized coiled-coil DUF342 family protein